MVRRADVCMDFPFMFVITGLIVALIMNTAAAGATVRLRSSPKYHLSDFVYSAHNFLNIPQGSSGGVSTGDSKFVTFCLSSPRSDKVVTVAGFVLMALVFTNIATSCQYIRFLWNVIFGRNGCRDVMKIESNRLFQF
jgi:hypothetical protein